MNSRLDDLKQNISSNPSDPRSHFELGCAAQDCGQLELAIDCFTKVTQLADHVAVGHFNLGNACFSLQRYEQAARAFQRACELSPDRGTLNNLGNSLAAMGNFRQAISRYQQALQLPDDGTPNLVMLKNLAMAFEAEGDRPAATSTYRQAVALPNCPASVLYQLGKLLAKSDVPQALSLLSQHAAQVQSSPELLALQADCLATQHALEPALASLMQACDLTPDHPLVLASLGEHYFLRGRHFESLVCLHRALSYEPNNSSVHSAWLRSQLYQDTVEWPRFRQEAERWDHHQQDVLATHNGHAEAINDYARAGSRLHLGLIAGRSTIGKLLTFVEPLLVHAEAHQYAVTCYIDDEAGPADPRLQNLHNFRWVTTGELGDNRLRTMIQNDGIDVLIDLVGHGPGNRLHVFAQRSASLQVAWAGWPATTGLHSMDYLLADSTTILDDESERFTERICRLPNGLLSCLPLELEEASVQVARSNPVLGSICSAAQLSEKTLSAWSKTMRQLPTSQLKLADANYSDASLKKEVLEKFRTREIDTNRVELLAIDDIDEFLRSLNVLLDPFPWNTTDACCRSLLLGTPVIALCGDRMSARTTASILEAAGLKQWVAESPDQYSQLVCQITSAPPSQPDLQRRVATSQLCDTVGWARAFIDSLQTLLAKEPTGS